MSDSDTQPPMSAWPRTAPVRQAIVYGTCHNCGRGPSRLLARDTRTCVVEVYDKGEGAYVMRSDPRCMGGEG